MSDLVSTSALDLKAAAPELAARAPGPTPGAAPAPGEAGANGADAGLGPGAAPFDQLLDREIDALAVVADEADALNGDAAEPVLELPPQDAGLPLPGNALPPVVPPPGGMLAVEVDPAADAEPGTAALGSPPRAPVRRDDRSSPGAIAAAGAGVDGVPIAETAPAGTGEGAASAASRLGSRSAGEAGAGPVAEPAAAAQTASSTASVTTPGSGTPEGLRRDALAGGAVSADLPHPPGSARWSEGLGERVMWMLDSRNQVAELRLTPPELGRLDVRISVNGSEASIQFAASSAAVREAVDAALPRLREMLEADGLSLAHADVADHGQHAAEHGDEEPGPGARGGSAARGVPDTGSDVSGQPVPGVARAGLLDQYA